MKLVKEHINEKFTEDSDPIKDMNIGIKKLEKYIVSKYLYFNSEYKPLVIFKVSAYNNWKQFRK